jgi:hypothetical protein
MNVTATYTNCGIEIVEVVPFRTLDRFGAEVEVHEYQDGDPYGFKVKKNGTTYAAKCTLYGVAKLSN